ncbi:MAG: alpha/beta hydrolase [Ilumatobacter sp.]
MDAEHDPSNPTALEALHPLASSEVAVHERLTHREVYTSRGLLSALIHEPIVEASPAALVMCGGAMGGLLGPGHGLYQVLGDRWAARGVRTIRINYRSPNDVDRCAHDLACGVEWARDAGAERIVVMGHSFGGAVAVRTAVVMPGSVAGVVTFATQSAGCEVASALAGRPLLLFHGDRDEILPAEASHMVHAIAGHGDVVILEGDGHLLAKSDEAIITRLDSWLPGVLGV